MQPTSKKRRKGVLHTPITFGVIRSRLNNVDARDVRILVDSGASESLVRHDVVRKLRLQKAKPAKWNTAAGTFTTEGTCKVKLCLPEFYTSKHIDWKFHTTKQPLSYDMIIGRDLLSELGMIIDFQTHTYNGEMRPYR